MLDVVRNPLAQSGRPGDFIRLTLALAAGYGMPGRTIALLDDVAAMLGMYEPLATGPAGHLAGPLIQWRSFPDQPTYTRVEDVEKLAFAQRALIAFGGAPSGQMVGTAEICCAMGNIIRKEHPPEYFDIYTWASLDVLQILLGVPKEELLKDESKKGWTIISDDEVLKPGGRLYDTYMEVCSVIRRDAIRHLNSDPSGPRRYLRPIAAAFLDSHKLTLTEARAEGRMDVVANLEKVMGSITGMFPDLKSIEGELAGQHAG